MPATPPVVAPFAALRYTPQAGPLSALLAPPYDVISPEEQAWLYEQQEHNIIRLELGRSCPGDDGQSNRYTRAAATLQQSLAERIMARDPVPSLYPYVHTFTLDGEQRQRLGMFAAVRLSDFSAGVVLPHEATRGSAKADRLELLRATGAQISPVFALYEQGQAEVRPVLTSCLETPPVAKAVLGEERHELWQVTDPAAVERVQAALGAGPLYIADGHHRYETALAYSAEMAERHPAAGPDAPWNYVLMMLVGIDDPGLVILPTTRLLKLGADARGQVEKAAAGSFEVRRGAVTPGEAAATLAELRRQGKRAFAVLTREGGLWLTLRPTVDVPADPRGALDVSLLQSLLIDRLIAPDLQERQVTYAMGEMEPARLVAGGACDAAVFLNPTTAQEVVAVARAGQRMPHKSTYFHPKPPTGLVVNMVGE